MTGIGQAFGAPARRSSGFSRTYDEAKTHPTQDLYFIKQLGTPTTLAVQTAIDDRTVTVSSAASFSQGNYLAMFSTDVQASARYYFGTVLSVVGNVITVDTPIDYAFKVGSNVLSTTRSLNVNGATTPQVFEVRAGGQDTNLIIDVTRIIVSMECDSAVDLNKFGNLPPLTNGIVLRQMNGDYRNKWNIKKNIEFGVLAYDLSIFQASNPIQAQDGLLTRYTLNGPDKHDAVIRLYPGESLQLIVQDDLTGLTDFRMIAAMREYGCE
jgi:hypothetical protein